MQLAMEAKDREREMTVQLIIQLTPQLLSKDQVALGFTRLLACAEVCTHPCTLKDNWHSSSSLHASRVGRCFAQ